MPDLLSADVVMHSPLQKIHLSRSNSDDKHMLAAVSEMCNRSHSDPNMLDTNTEDSQLQDASQSPLEASGENSSFSSNENLLETVNNAFKKLGEKYSQFHLSENEDVETGPPRDPADSVDDVVDGETELAKVTPSSMPKRHDTPREHSDPETQIVPRPKNGHQNWPASSAARPNKVPKLVVTRHVFSDPLLDRDGTTHVDGFSIHEDKDGHAVVRPKTTSKVTSKIETFQMALTENESWQAPTRGRVRRISDSIYHATPVKTTGSSSDEEKAKPKSLDNTPTSLSRSGRNRRSVRDVVNKFEKPSPLKNETKVITPTALGIQQRLRAIRQNAEFHKQSQQDVSSSRIKSLRERRLELEEWVSRPHS